MSYDELIEGINKAPMTYVPALLIAVVKRAERDRIFLPGKMQQVIDHAIAEQNTPT